MLCVTWFDICSVKSSDGNEHELFFASQQEWVESTNKLLKAASWRSWRRQPGQPLNDRKVTSCPFPERCDCEGGEAETKAADSLPVARFVLHHQAAQSAWKNLLYVSSRAGDEIQDAAFSFFGRMPRELALETIEQAKRALSIFWLRRPPHPTPTLKSCNYNSFFEGLRHFFGHTQTINYPEFPF